MKAYLPYFNFVFSYWAFVASWHTSLASESSSRCGYCDKSQGSVGGRGQVRNRSEETGGVLAPEVGGLKWEARRPALGSQAPGIGVREGRDPGEMASHTGSRVISLNVDVNLIWGQRSLLQGG